MLTSKGQNKVVVLQSDFGMKDGAVAAMKGVAVSVSSDLKIFDLTHDIPAFNIWEAAYRLEQTSRFWPAGTVFVSVVDPGVGSDRKSIVAKTKSGHFFVTPDNGTLTLVSESLGVEEVRVIDEEKNRLSSSYESHTFHGRDVFAYTAARLAGGVISFQEVGPVLESRLILLPYKKAKWNGQKIVGSVDVLDIQYGNVWSNIPKDMIDEIKVSYGQKVRIKITHKGKVAYNESVTFGKSFSDVPIGETVAYINSLMKFSIGVNMGSFAEKFKIGTGPDWQIEVSR
jgi:S-adenosylmethionine hydrolase